VNTKHVESVAVDIPNLAATFLTPMRNEAGIILLPMGDIKVRNLRMPMSPELRDILFILDHELGDLRQIIRVTHELGEKAARLQPALVAELVRAKELINQALKLLA
jgi:hypothetical protein